MAQMLLRRDLLMVGVCLVVAGFLSLVIYQIGVYPLQLFLHFSDDVVSILLRSPYHL